MPIYPLKCNKCEKKADKEMSFSEYDKFKNGEKIYCECGGEYQREWVMNSLITHYACDGFYDTDSKTGAYRVR